MWNDGPNIYIDDTDQTFGTIMNNEVKRDWFWGNSKNNSFSLKCLNISLVFSILKEYLKGIMINRDMVVLLERMNLRIHSTGNKNNIAQAK